MQSCKRLFSLIFIPLLLAAACTREQTPPPAIRVAYAPHDHHASLYVAAMKPEYFQQNGNLYLREITPKKEYELSEGGATVARVLVDTSGGGAQNIQKILEDQADIAFGSFPEMVKAIDEGKKLKIIAPLMSGGTGLVVAKDSALKDWKSFVYSVRYSKTPFRIGVKTAGSVQELAIQNALAAEGITVASGLGGPNAKVTIINLHGQKNLLPAMRSELVDAIAVMQPITAEAEYAQVGKVIANLEDYEGVGDRNYFPCCAICVSDSFLEKNREAVEKLMTLMLRANKHINEDPAGQAVAVAKWLETPEAVEQKSLPTIIYSGGFDSKWHDSTDAWLKMMVEKNLLHGEVRKAFENHKQRELLYDRKLMEKLAG